MKMGVDGLTALSCIVGTDFNETKDGNVRSIARKQAAGKKVDTKNTTSTVPFIEGNIIGSDNENEN